MSAKRDRSQGISFVLSDGTPSMILEALKHTQAYAAFGEDAADPSVDDTQLAVDLEILASDIFRHLEEGIEPQVIKQWVSEDLAKAGKGK